MGAMVIINLRHEGSTKKLGTWPIWASVNPDGMARQLVIAFNDILQEGYYIETEIDPDWVL